MQKKANDNLNIYLIYIKNLDEYVALSFAIKLVISKQKSSRLFQPTASLYDKGKNDELIKDN